MRITKHIERDEHGRVLWIDESVAFDSDDERTEWWARATSPITGVDMSRYFPRGYTDHATDQPLKESTMQGTHIAITLPDADTYAPQGLESFLNVNGYHGAHFDFFIEPRRRRASVEVSSDRLDVDITDIKERVEFLIKEFDAQARGSQVRTSESRRQVANEESDEAPAEIHGTETSDNPPVAGDDMEARGVATQVEAVDRPEVLDLPAEARKEIDPKGEARRIKEAKKRS